MRRILLDTEVVATLRKAQTDPAVARWIGSVPADRLWLHPVVIAEIRAGIEHSRQQGQQDLVGARERWLERLRASGQLASFGGAEADVWGRMMASPLLRHGAALPRDMMIAATAIVGDFAVATIEGAGLRLIHRHFPLPGLIDPSNPAGLATLTALDAPVRPEPLPAE